MNPAALLSYSHRGNMLWGVRSKSGLKTYMYWVPCFYRLVGWKHLDVRQRERMAKCPQCRDAKHPWCVSLSWSPSAGLSCCLVQWGGGVGRTGLWSPAILFLCPKTACCCPVTHASLSCRERDSKDNGSGGEANRNVNSLGEVRWNIATEASFIGCRGQDDALALHLLPLTHLPSAFPCLRMGNAGLAIEKCPETGAGQECSAPARGAEGAWGSVPPTSIKRNQNSSWPIPGNLVPIGQLLTQNIRSVPGPRYRLRRIPACL